jgi:Mitochondrial carrier protein
MTKANESSRSGSDDTSSSSISILSNALASAAAGIISRLCTHPLDTSKARLQYTPHAQPNPYTGPIHVLVRTFHTEGLAGLYRGLGAVLVGGTPGTVVYLCTYEIVKAELSTDRAPPFLTHFMAGMIAETIACIIYVPVDVVKERMQVQHAATPSIPTDSPATLYRNSWDAFRKIVRYEGFSGIYRGYAATLASFGPFSALYFVFYEQFKDLARHQSPSNADLSFSATVVCAAAAGGLASWLTSPLDMAKLRLQVQRGRLASQHPADLALTYSGMWDCLRHTWQTEGVRGLFRGAGARVLHFAPATTVTMTTYEMCRKSIEPFLYPANEIGAS